MPTNKSEEIKPTDPSRKTVGSTWSVKKAFCKLREKHVVVDIRKDLARAFELGRRFRDAELIDEWWAAHPSSDELKDLREYDLFRQLDNPDITNEEWERIVKELGWTADRYKIEHAPVKCRSFMSARLPSQ